MSEFNEGLPEIKKQPYRYIIKIKDHFGEPHEFSCTSWEISGDCLRLYDSETIGLFSVFNRPDSFFVSEVICKK